MRIVVVAIAVVLGCGCGARQPGTYEAIVLEDGQPGYLLKCPRRSSTCWRGADELCPRGYDHDFAEPGPPGQMKIRCWRPDEPCSCNNPNSKRGPECELKEEDVEPMEWGR